jgi:4-diphosphocytidyl-2-C-methyl-D-erythritol kinase
VSKGHTQTTVFAPAKINLFLHVGDKRADGYHNICSLAAFADVGDVIGAAPSDTLTLTTTGAFAGAMAGDDDDNLVLRAARGLKIGRRQLTAAPTARASRCERTCPSLPASAAAQLTPPQR